MATSMTISEEHSCIMPSWPLPVGVRSIVSTRFMGGSQPPYQSNNLAMHVKDNPELVASNRQALQRKTGMPTPCWLDQVHGTDVIGTKDWHAQVQADACWAASKGKACVVLTADCLPILLCNLKGTEVAAVHAGWRGLAAGILEKALGCFSDPPNELMAYIGPHISAAHFEVGPEVKAAMQARGLSGQVLEKCFKPAGAKLGAKHFADLAGLARAICEACGTKQVYGGDHCSVDGPAFYSFRKEGITGRNASAIWLSDP